MKRPEQAVQLAIVNYLEVALPHESSFFCHVPNGGYRGKIEAVIFKRLGVKAGVPDLLVMVAGQTPIWFEVKAPGTGQVTKAQMDVMEHLSRLGSHCFVVDCVEHVETTLLALGVKLKAHTGDTLDPEIRRKGLRCIEGGRAEEPLVQLRERPEGRGLRLGTEPSRDGPGPEGSGTV